MMKLPLSSGSVSQADTQGSSSTGQHARVRSQGGFIHHRRNRSQSRGARISRRGRSPSRSRSRSRQGSECSMESEFLINSLRERIFKLELKLSERDEIIDLLLKNNAELTQTMERHKNIKTSPSFPPENHLRTCSLASITSVESNVSMESLPAVIAAHSAIPPPISLASASVNPYQSSTTTTPVMSPEDQTDFHLSLEIPMTLEEKDEEENHDDHERHSSLSSDCISINLNPSGNVRTPPPPPPEAFASIPCHSRTPSVASLFSTVMPASIAATKVVGKRRSSLKQKPRRISLGTRPALRQSFSAKRPSLTATTNKVKSNGASKKLKRQRTRICKSGGSRKRMRRKVLLDRVDTPTEGELRVKVMVRSAKFCYGHSHESLHTYVKVSLDGRSLKTDPIDDPHSCQYNSEFDFKYPSDDPILSVTMKKLIEGPNGSKLRGVVLAFGDMDISNHASKFLKREKRSLKGGGDLIYQCPVPIHDEEGFAVGKIYIGIQFYRPESLQSD